MSRMVVRGGGRVFRRSSLYRDDQGCLERDGAKRSDREGEDE